MTPRAPLFAGVAGGVGTTTLAVALHGIDGGRYDGRPVDVLVCRADGASLARAAASTGAPVLAVVTDGALPGAARTWLGRLRPRFGRVVLLPHVGHWRELDEPLTEAARLLALPPERRPRALRPYADALLEITAALLGAGTLTGAPVRPAPRPLPAPPVPAPRLIGRPTRSPVVLLPAPGGPVAPAPVVSRVLWRGLAPVERLPVPAVPDQSSRRRGPARHDSGEAGPDRTVHGPDPTADLDDDALEACGR